MGVGGDIGFDEGGVFQALSDPIYTKTTVEYTYRTVAKQPMVKTETTKVINITGAHVLAAVLGPALIALIINTKGLSVEQAEAMLAGSLIFGPFSGPIIGKAAADISTEDASKWVIDFITKVSKL